MADASLARLEELLQSPIVVAHLIAPSRDITAPDLRHSAAHLRAFLREHHPHEPQHALILDVLTDPESVLHELEREYLSELLLRLLENLLDLVRHLQHREQPAVDD